MLNILMLQLSNIDNNDIHLAVSGLGTISRATGHVFLSDCTLPHPNRMDMDLFLTVFPFLTFGTACYSNHFTPFQATSSHFKPLQAISSHFNPCELLGCLEMAITIPVSL
jgi:hypothetical protein